MTFYITYWHVGLGVHVFFRPV